MVVEKKPTSDATKQGDKTAKTSKDSTDPTKPEENTPKDAKKPIVEDEDLVNYLITREMFLSQS